MFHFDRDQLGRGLSHRLCHGPRGGRMAPDASDAGDLAVLDVGSHPGLLVDGHFEPRRLFGDWAEQAVASVPRPPSSYSTCSSAWWLTY